MDSQYIKYETNDKLAYADIEVINNTIWHICMIESKRKGGGIEIINKIISEAKIKNIKEITLTTTEHSGYMFFNKLGFSEIGNNNDPYDIPMILFI